MTSLSTYLSLMAAAEEAKTKEELKAILKKVRLLASFDAEDSAN